jgi:LEA14-like dessication related protein
MSYMMKMKSFAFVSLIVVSLGIIFSCKSAEVLAEQPQKKEVVPEAVPQSNLVFENIEAENPETLYLNFKLDVHNTTSQSAELLFQNAELLINGNPANELLFSINLPQQEPLMKQETKSIPLRLVFHASEYEKITQADFDEYNLTLTVPVQCMFPEKTIDSAANAQANFPRVRKPNFTIAMIRITQAELINTRLKVSLYIDNPNHFPMELASFSYELYGEERFWAKGEKNDIFTIPAKDSAGIDLFLTMNFTNMHRNVLDQIIAMTKVRYRFAGNANIETGIDHLPRFAMQFEQEGHSEVIR